MSINFRSEVFEEMIDNFAKSITRTPVTKSNNPLTGEEILTDGTTAILSGSLYRKIDAWGQSNPGLFQNADAIVIIKTSVTINKNDKLNYDSENYRVNNIITRRLGTTSFYKIAECFKI